MGTIKILIDETTKNPFETIGMVAGTCYGTKTDDYGRNTKRGKQCVEDGHGRVLELVHIKMIIDGYSAKCIRELYTHIGGGPTRLQASTRYIDYSKEKNFKIVKPNSVKKNDVANSVWDHTIQEIRCAMLALKECGIPTEDLTNLLPLAYETKMVWDVNLRTLINFMNMRLCSRAYWEIRQLAKDICNALKEVNEYWAEIVELYFIPKCEAVGYCTEHECCGRAMKKEELDNLIEEKKNERIQTIQSKKTEEE